MSQTELRLHSLIKRISPSYGSIGITVAVVCTGSLYILMKGNKPEQTKTKSSDRSLMPDATTSDTLAVQATTATLERTTKGMGLTGSHSTLATGRVVIIEVQVATTADKEEEHTPHLSWMGPTVSDDIDSDAPSASVTDDEVAEEDAQAVVTIKMAPEKERREIPALLSVVEDAISSRTAALSAVDDAVDPSGSTGRLKATPRRWESKPTMTPEEIRTIFEETRTTITEKKKTLKQEQAAAEAGDPEADTENLEFQMAILSIMEALATSSTDAPA